ncbi:MAG: RDD family protein [Alphaproteobacteria bacterium]|nr:RDD family protein [Alphaproteobacteria bacterium]
MLLYKTIAQKKAKAVLENKPPYASALIRLLATFIDLILSCIIIVPLFAIFNKMMFGDMSSYEIANRIVTHKDQIIFGKFITSYILQSLFLLALIFLFWISKNATPGKTLFKLKIVDAETLAEPSKKQYVIRLMGYMLATLPLGLGFIWIVFSSKGQGWHDIISHTVVIHENKLKRYLETC